MLGVFTGVLDHLVIAVTFLFSGFILFYGFLGVQSGPSGSTELSLGTSVLADNEVSLG